MTMQALVLEIRWPDGRFHGMRPARGSGRAGEADEPEWPPSPFRLFQALVAGAYAGRWAAEERLPKDRALEWLEQLDAPVISAPRAMTLGPVTYYVPNNDLDTKGSDPARVAEVRVARTRIAQTFDRDRPVVYVWRFDDDDAEARLVAALSERMHTFGHGVDAAFAHARIIDAQEADRMLSALGGVPYRPAMRAPSNDRALDCPTSGSLESLHERHAAFAVRLRPSGVGRKATTRFHQPPRPHLRTIAYQREAAPLLYELRAPGGGLGFRVAAIEKAMTLVIAVRDQIAERLRGAYPAEVDRLVLGLGARPTDIELRLRIVPLPSIGMRHTNMGIRRVAIEVPPDSPITAADIAWAVSGVRLALEEDAAEDATVLVPAESRTMLARYGSGGLPAPRALVWQSVTPVALPRIRAKTQDGAARVASETKLEALVVQALRHAGVARRPTSIRVQREPFDEKGEMAARFEAGRFEVAGLRHVEIAFDGPVAGPLVLGNGRWLGLGVMRPIAGRGVWRMVGPEGMHAFTLKEGTRIAPEDVEALTRALRRAVMARAQRVAESRLTRGSLLPTFFTGHDDPSAYNIRGGPASSGLHEHLFFAFDEGEAGRLPRLLVIPPHLADRNAEPRLTSRRFLGWLREALDGLTDLRAGRLGRFVLAASHVADDDLLIRPAKSWQSMTDYVPTRFFKGRENVNDAVTIDIAEELRRRNLPIARVEVLRGEIGPRGGVRARLRLTFASAVAGPLIIGRSSHFGAGLFRSEYDDRVVPSPKHK